MMIDQTASFADLLRRFRVAAGLTQETLADEAGLSARGISDLERGARRAPYAETVRRIADSLRLTASERAELLAARARPDATTDVQPSAQRRLHNLPPPLTSFVGRQREVAELHKVLRSTRLLTLTGAGGVGKTRLALELAANMLGIYADGVWLVELASVSDASLVPQGVAAVLGIREQPGRSYLAKLSDQLQSKHLLLVLDNCEQVLEACAELTNRLLQSSPHVAFLTTSREPLRVRGEVSWPVPALSISDSPGQALDDNGKASEAAQLFVERARAVRPDFALTAENAAAVADLCRRLDGLPLAIELAAARTRAVPVRALVQMLTSASGGLPILTDGPRGVPERQRTLRSTIAWSYDLLSADEQALFRRLGVCRGAGLETIQSVCIAANDGPGTTSIALPALHLNALNGVSSLVSKSLVRLEGDDETEPRYVMLETVREFALERLEASGEGPAVRRRHALHFLRLSRTSSRGCMTPTAHDSSVDSSASMQTGARPLTGASDRATRNRVCDSALVWRPSGCWLGTWLRVVPS